MSQQQINHFQSPLLNPRNIVMKFLKADEPIQFTKTNGEKGEEVNMIFEYTTKNGEDHGTAQIAVRLTSDAMENYKKVPFVKDANYVCNGFFNCEKFTTKEGVTKYTTQLVLSFVKPQKGSPTETKERKSLV